MHSDNTKPTKESPFFALMADADSIQVQEISTETSALHDYSSRFSDSRAGRTFIVQIAPPPPEEIVQKDVAPAAAPEAAKAPTQISPERNDREFVLKNAMLLLNNNDHLLARNLFSYLLKQDIRDQQALRGLGICFFRLGDSVPAKKCFKALWELYSLPESLAWLGFCYSSEGDDGIAIDHFRKIPDPQKLESALRFDYFKELGNCLTRMGQYDAAEKTYRHALEVNPESDVVFVNLGTLQIQKNNLELAQSYFIRATQIQPQNSKAHCGLGLVDLAKGDYFSASKEFNLTLDLDSQNWPALSQLVLLANYSKSYSAVKIRLVQFLLKDPKNLEARYALAVVLFREGHFAESEREVDRLLAADLKNVKAQKLKEELTQNKHRG